MSITACAAKPEPGFVPLPALDDEQLNDISTPRFAATLDAVGRAVPDRATLLTTVQSRLQALQHIRREPSSPAAPDDNPETPAANAPRLTRGDLLTITLLLDGLQNPATRNQLGRMIREDRADKTSEHGGVIRAADRGIDFIVIPPMLGGRDMEYITSDDAMHQATTSIALFHMHAHQVDDADLAGPGIGDLRFSHDMQMTCVVITSLSANSFDVDYYTPEGAILDLGIYFFTP